MTDRSRYLPISSYAAIGNTRTAALIGLNASMDWCCFPDLDGPSVFAAILDSRKGGHWRVAPSGAHLRSQRYLPETNVLETRFEHDGAMVTVTDFMPLKGSLVGVTPQPVETAIYRLVTCERAPLRRESEGWLAGRPWERWDSNHHRQRRGHQEDR